MAKQAFKNKVALVTGGGRGIGLAVARRFAVDGAQVVLADIDEANGARAEEAIRGEGGDAFFCKCDVGDGLEVRNLVCAARERYGHVDVLVNNAGVSHGAEFLEVEAEDFARVLRVNLHGAFLVGQAVAREMVADVKAGRAPGCIVNMSSINAQVAIANQVPYVVSKGGISQLTKAMALALAPHGIRVNAIAPGSIETEMLRAVNADAAGRERMLSRTPLGRIGGAEEIAGVAAFLAGADASYVTGEVVVADGGRLALNYVVPTGAG